MYTYPEYLNALQRVAVDLFTRAWEVDPIRFPYKPADTNVRVAADSRTGTASVDWSNNPTWGRLHVVINMPVKAANYVVSETEFSHGVAYLLHEVGHPLHTCKATWDAAVARKAHNLLNALEDVREEKATIDLGLAVNATLMFGSLIDSLHAKAIAKGYDPNSTHSIGWTLSLLGRKANGYEVDASDVAHRLDPNGTVAGIIAWALPALAQCRSTKDCLDLADRVTDAIRAARKPQSQPEPQPEPEVSPEDLDAFEEEMGASSGDEDEGEGGGGDEVDDIMDGSSVGFEPQSAPAQDETEDKQKAGQGSHNTPGEPKPEDKPEDKPEVEPLDDELVEDVDMTPNKNEVLTSSSGKDFNAAREVVHQIRRIVDQPFRDKQVHGRAVRYGYGGKTTVDVVTEGAAKMGRQRSLLAAALKREELDDFEGGRMHGRLDRRRLSRLTTGNPHVFGKRTIAEGYDTDVQVLIDGSTSMSNERIIAAATLGLVVAQSAAQVGVECAAHVFNEDGLHAITKGRAKPLGRRFAYAYNQVDGCTPLTVNLLACAFEQKRRAPNKRRVIFLITDGGCDLGPDVLKAAGLYVEGIVGAEIANLHIGYRPMGMFRNECAVNVNDVPATGVKSFTQVLERGAR